MEATTFKVRTPEITGGRSHTPLVRTEAAAVSLNYYSAGRENKLHTHPGEDHAFLVLDGEATFYDRDGKPTVLRKGEGIMLPEGWYYRFRNSGDKPLALLRFTAYKSRPMVKRVDVEGRTREEDETDYVCVDGEPIPGRHWEFS